MKRNILSTCRASDQITQCLFILLTMAAFSVATVHSNKGFFSEKSTDHHWQEESMVNDVSREVRS